MPFDIASLDSIIPNPTRTKVNAKNILFSLKVVVISDPAT